jgi:hypothetical protein
MSCRGCRATQPCRILGLPASDVGNPSTMTDPGFISFIRIRRPLPPHAFWRYE